MVMKNKNTGYLSGTGGMLRLWTHNIRAADVSHDLAKKNKVKFIFCKGVTLVLNISVVFPVNCLKQGPPLYNLQPHPLERKEASFSSGVGRRLHEHWD